MTTDYYSLAENGLIALLKTELASPYFPHADIQVTASDDTVYDNGNDYYATTYPSRFPVTEISGSRYEYSYDVVLDILARWTTTELAAWNAFKTYRNAVIDLVNQTNKGHNLNKTNFVRDAFMQSDVDPRYIPVKGSDPNDPDPTISHIGQVCVVTVKMIVPR